MEYHLNKTNTSVSIISHSITAVPENTPCSATSLNNEVAVRAFSLRIMKSDIFHFKVNSTGYRILRISSVDVFVR
jgi:hypothetical protein